MKLFPINAEITPLDRFKVWRSSTESNYHVGCAVLETVSLGTCRRICYHRTVCQLSARNVRCRAITSSIPQKVKTHSLAERTDVDTNASNVVCIHGRREEAIDSGVRQMAVRTPAGKRLIFFSLLCFSTNSGADRGSGRQANKPVR